MIGMSLLPLVIGGWRGPLEHRRIERRPPRLVPDAFHLVKATCADPREAWADAAVREMEDRLHAARNRLVAGSTCTGATAGTHAGSAKGSGSGSSRGGSGGGFGCGGGPSSRAGTGGESAFDGGYDDPASDGAAAGSDDGADGIGAAEFSTTNVSVKGVDEADFVKNDGEHIYVLSGGRLQVIRAWPPEQAEVVGTLALAGTPREMFVYADRAVVFVSGESDGTPDALGNWCAYSAACDLTGDGRKLTIVVVDVSDRAHPKVVREVAFSGTYLESRRVGDSIFAAVYSPGPGGTYLGGWLQTGLGLPVVPAKLASYGCSAGVALGEAEVDRLYEDLRESNEAEIRDAALAWPRPEFEDTLLGGAAPEVRTGSMMPCGALLRPAIGAGVDLVSIVGLRVTGSDMPRVTTILSQPGAVQASTGALHVAVRRSQDLMTQWYGEVQYDPWATTVHRFALDGDSAAATYEASGVVKGHVLGGFAVDEWQGAVRVATTTGVLPSPDVHSTVSVLKPSGGGTLSTVGSVDRIAEGEDIRSVRFDGAEAFVVTFKKTDPLFRLDLSDPYRPRISGQLKVPGFSTYIQRLDAGNLLTVGFDAQDEGSFAWFRGLLLQVFDVSDPDHPTLRHKATIGTRGSSSAATADRLAVNFFRPKGLLALPAAVCDGGSGGSSWGEELSFDGLLVYRVTAGDGFEALGGIPRGGTTSDPYACSSWWTQPRSIVKRSIFMDDWVFAIAEDRVQAARLSDLAHPACTIGL